MIRALLFEPAPLSNNKGPLLDDYRCHRFNSHKDLKRSGHVVGRIIHPNMKWKEIYQEGLEPQEYWDDWKDKKRDGLRFTYKDATRFKKVKGYVFSKYNFNQDWKSPDRINNKLKRLLARRFIAKRKQEFLYSQDASE